MSMRMLLDEPLMICMLECPLLYRGGRSKARRLAVAHSIALPDLNSAQLLLPLLLLCRFRSSHGGT
jgi:hypothetical protein